MSKAVGQVAEALAQSFRDTVARVSGDSWETTGVTLPSKEVFERYAEVAVTAFLLAARSDAAAAEQCEASWLAYLATRS